MSFGLGLGLLGSDYGVRSRSVGAHSRVLSGWEKQVTANNTWRKYPRPQMLRPQWQTLNGMWDYAITSKNCARAHLL